MSRKFMICVVPVVTHTLPRESFYIEEIFLLMKKPSLQYQVSYITKSYSTSSVLYYSSIFLLKFVIHEENEGIQKLICMKKMCVQDTEKCLGIKPLIELLKSPKSALQSFCKFLGGNTQNYVPSIVCFCTFGSCYIFYSNE